MAESQTADRIYDINPSTYQWSVRVFRTIKKLLSVNVKLHGEKSQIEQGDILLFNHFSRFETFIPQYLIYEETGIYCCAVAAGEFFDGDDVFGNFLRNVGAIPHNHEDLLPLLARQILRGRKVIIFPEGGMVKDRRVIDESGDYSVYSRTADNRRKHHTGAAVLALALDVFKMAVKKAYANGESAKLERWTDQVGLDDVGQLLAASLRTTSLVPSNITFYPIRVSDNILRKGAELLNEGLTRRHSEEFLIEGNIILKDTDMDIRLGRPMCTSDYWGGKEKHFIENLSIENLDDVFHIQNNPKQWSRWLLTKRIRSNAEKIRDEYMHRMYTCVTVNLSHLASTIIMFYVANGETEINKDRFHRSLYLSVKRIQNLPDINLHRSLRNPEYYWNIINGRSERLELFISMTESSDLVEPLEETYHLLPKLREQQDFDVVRMENLAEVYANELTPLADVTRQVKVAMDEVDALDQRNLADLHFDDEILSWRWDKEYFSKPCFDDINSKETATSSAEPFFLKPKKPNGFGVVLTHGFLASPAEVRGFGERLVSQGYTVISPRLKGHGTSPRELREKRWEDWFESVRRVYDILKCHTERIFLVGFSTGGALSLLLAADQPDEVVAVAAISVPIKFRDTGMMLIPLLHRTNTLVRWLSSYEGVKPFFPNDTEHPDINYRHMPVRGLYELRQLVHHLEDRLSDVHCPTLLLQSNEDPVVIPKSADIIFERLASSQKKLITIRSKRHGILVDDIDNTQLKLLAFLDAFSSSESAIDGSASANWQIFDRKLADFANKNP